MSKCLPIAGVYSDRLLQTVCETSGSATSATQAGRIQSQSSTHAELQTEAHFLQRRVRVACARGAVYCLDGMAVGSTCSCAARPHRA